MNRAAELYERMLSRLGPVTQQVITHGARAHPEDLKGAQDWIDVICWHLMQRGFGTQAIAGVVNLGFKTVRTRIAYIEEQLQVRPNKWHAMLERLG